MSLKESLFSRRSALIPILNSGNSFIKNIGGIKSDVKFKQNLRQVQLNLNLLKVEAVNNIQVQTVVEFNGSCDFPDNITLENRYLRITSIPNGR
jgi:hypothetical protein